MRTPVDTNTRAAVDLLRKASRANIDIDAMRMPRGLGRRAVGPCASPGLTVLRPPRHRLCTFQMTRWTYCTHDVRPHKTRRWLLADVHHDFKAPSSAAVNRPAGIPSTATPRAMMVLARITSVELAESPRVRYRGLSANSTLWVMSVMAILVRIHSGEIKVAFLNACFSKSRWSMIKRRVRKQNISRSRALSAYSVKSPLR